MAVPGHGAPLSVGWASEGVAEYLAESGTASVATALLSWVVEWATMLALYLGMFTLLLFPTGRLPGERWRAVAAVLLAVAAGEVLSEALAPGPLEAGTRQVNPFGIPGAAALTETVGAMARFLAPFMALACVISVFARYRRAGSEERQQIRWLGLAAAGSLATALVAMLASLFGIELRPLPFVVVVLSVPAAMSVALLRYRLYDIDVVINRVIVYALLVGLIIAVYTAATVGVGVFLLGQARPSPALSVAATALVAVVFQPARERFQRLADRLVFGRRATPYQVLAEFAERLAGTWSLPEVLPRLAGMLAEATGAVATAVFLRVGDDLVPAASWPEGAADHPVRLANAGGPVDGFDVVVPVEQRGEVLGALALRKAPGDRTTPADERVIRHLASQSALVFGNARLTAELERRVEEVSAQATELRESRRRLVAAQDTERRRIERNLHDGAQQELVALAAKLRLAANQFTRGSQDAPATLAEAQEDLKRAVSELRQLAQGIFPSVLGDRGVLAAVEVRAARMPLPVDVEADERVAGTRLAPEVEAAAYFVVTEALTNVLKHAAATQASVRLSAANGSLTVEVADDGRGISAPPGSGVTGMADRVAALGGALEVGPADGGGTVVRASIPVGAPTS